MNRHVRTQVGHYILNGIVNWRHLHCDGRDSSAYTSFKGNSVRLFSIAKKKMYDDVDESWKMAKCIRWHISYGPVVPQS